MGTWPVRSSITCRDCTTESKLEVSGLGLRGLGASSSVFSAESGKSAPKRRESWDRRACVQAAELPAIVLAQGRRNLLLATRHRRRRAWRQGPLEGPFAVRLWSQVPKKTYETGFWGYPNSRRSTADGPSGAGSHTAKHPNERRGWSSIRALSSERSACGGGRRRGAGNSPWVLQAPSTPERTAYIHNVYIYIYIEYITSVQAICSALPWAWGLKVQGSSRAWPCLHDAEVLGQIICVRDLLTRNTR